MRDYLENRQIRVFISSTFQDMQGERDYLMTKTFPILRHTAAQRDVTLTEVDLRWGVTEEESQSGRAVEICLNEIDNSIPFFIGIIGNRYGWCPKRSEVGGNSIMDRYGKWIEPCLENNLSVTEMEIQYGVLAREETVNAFFYIKDGEAVSDNIEKLEALKQKVLASRYPTERYSSMEELGAKVESAFVALIDRLFPEGYLRDVDKERITQRSFMNSLSQTYVRVEPNFTALDSFLDSGEQYYVVTGSSGLGKSALVANWIKSSASMRNGLAIAYHFIGNGGSLSSHLYVQRALCQEICAQYGFYETDFNKAIALAGASGRPLLIVIDAINQVLDAENSKQLGWIQQLPRNVKILYSTLEDDPTMAVFKSKNYPIYRIKPLELEMRRKFVNKYLKDNFGKRLTPEQVDRIVCAPMCENTLVLKTILNELIKFGVYEQLNHKIDSYLNASGIPEFYQKILDGHESDFGSSFVKTILSLIAVSKSGLSESEILGVTGFKPLHWSQFFCAFATHLNVKSGLISFSHSYIREAVESKYFAGSYGFECSCRRMIADYFKEHNNPRTDTELPHQLYYLKDYPGMHVYLLNADVLAFWMNYDSVEFARYWKLLLEMPDTEYSLDEYLGLADSESDRIGFYVRLINLAGVIADHPRKKKYCRILYDYLEANGVVAEPEVYRVLSSGSEQPYYLDLAKKALELSLAKYGEVHDDTAKSYGSLGAAYYDLAVAKGTGDYDQKAFDAWLNQNEISARLHGEYTPAAAESYRAMALVAPDHEEGLKYGLKSIDISKTIYGEHHPDLGWSYNHTGCVYRNLGQHDKALECFERSYDCWFPAYGEYHDLVAASVNNQACCHNRLGNFEKALEMHFRANRIRARVWGGGHDNANSILNIGATYHQMKDYEHALEYLRKAADIFEIEGTRPYYTALAYDKLSKVYADMGQNEEAEKLRLKAERIRANTR